MVDLKGKVTLVTGATSGIGTVTAEYLAGESQRERERCVEAAAVAPGRWRKLSAAGSHVLTRCPPRAVLALLVCVCVCVCVRVCVLRTCARAEHGAEVILGVRNVEAGEKLAKEIM
jgi:hypothetical protein